MYYAISRNCMCWVTMFMQRCRIDILTDYPSIRYLCLVVEVEPVRVVYVIRWQRAVLFHPYVQTIAKVVIDKRILAVQPRLAAVL